MMNPVHIGTYTPRRPLISRDNKLVIAILVPVAAGSFWFWSQERPFGEILSAISVTLSFAF